MLKPEILKKDFPIFSEQKKLVYLDSAATSQTPQVVLDAMNEYYAKYRANVHRGVYQEEETATTLYESAREKVARFIGAKSDEIIFTSGATAASNILMSMLEHSCEGRAFFREWAGGSVVTTVMEHHASMIPLQEFSRRNSLSFKTIPLHGSALDYKKAEQVITPDTKLVSVMLASNVTGTINDVARIVELARSVGAIVVCDATAAVGHIPVDVKELGVDFLYFSGHKMCGPTGIGVLWGKKELLKELEPGVYGGGIVDEVTLQRATWRGAPARFEAGTPNIAGVIGLGAAITYLEGAGIEKMHACVAELASEAVLRLEGVPGVRVVSEKDTAKNVGIVSFVVDGVHPHDVAQILAGNGVAVRAGHHCAMPLHAALGVSATVRASFYIYNTSEDIDALIDGVKKAKEVFKK